MYACMYVYIRFVNSREVVPGTTNRYVCMHVCMYIYIRFVNSREVVPGTTNRFVNSL
jgi:hypothetical protein